MANYRRVMRELAEKSYLDVWYERFDVERMIEFLEGERNRLESASPGHPEGQPEGQQPGQRKLTEGSAEGERGRQPAAPARPASGSPRHWA